MSELPSGTVTFLFTDIEASTRLLRELGERYADALPEHRHVLREAFAQYRGVEVDTQGDAFFVAFPSAAAAVAAAEEGRRALAHGPVRVPIGIHAGTPTSTDEGYVGLDVHKGARLAAAAHGGPASPRSSPRRPNVSPRPSPGFPEPPTPCVGRDAVSAPRCSAQASRPAAPALIGPTGAAPVVAFVSRSGEVKAVSVGADHPLVRRLDDLFEKGHVTTCKR